MTHEDNKIRQDILDRVGRMIADFQDLHEAVKQGKPAGGIRLRILELRVEYAERAVKRAHEGVEGDQNDIL